MKIKKCLLPGVSLFLFTFVSLAPSFAADTPPDINLGDELKALPVLSAEVIASRIPSSKGKIRNSASNVTLKTREDLDRQRAATFQEAVRDTESGVFYDEVGNGVDTTFVLRGFSNPRNVTFLVDGVRANEVDGGAVNFPLLVMDEIDAVQIDRGSASSVYGSGAFGGVVNITTGRPGPKPFQTFGGLEWSSFHGLRFHEGFSGTLQDKVTGLGGRGSYYFQGGRNLRQGFRPNTEARITNFDFKTSYELPEEDGKIYFGLKHVADAISNPGEMTFQQFQDDAGRTNKPLDGRKFSMTIWSLGADKKFFDDHLTASILASQRTNTFRSFTTFGTFTDFAQGFNPDTNFITQENGETSLTWQLEHEDSWGEEWDHQAFLGMELRRGSNTSTQRDAFDGEISDAFGAETDRNARKQNVGIFWRETLGWADKFIPYFGMRHDFHRLQSEDILTPANSVTQRWHDSTLSTGATFRLSESADFFLNYSQGFRAPEIDDVIPFAGAVSTGLIPEKSDSYEAGTRLWVRDKAKTTFSYFLIDVKDEIRFDSTTVTQATPFGRNINIGRTRRYGLELRQEAKPAEGLNLYGSYTWTRALVRETDGAEALVDGRTLGLIPEHRFTLGGIWAPLLKLGPPYDGFKLGLYGAFTGKQNVSSYESTGQALLNATEGAGHWIKPYSVWDFQISQAWKDFEVYFKINNVFNEKYYSRAVNATSFGTVIYPAGNFTFVNPGAPREYVIGSRYEF